ncbi:D-allose transporter substrate-binding protein [Treponema sp. OMZ 840]|uniref:D-allose transporter substrate-binding protein n=1 Tax=Treponema sp. OMZ 840 TaxID=244313 RepID=UPI003D8DE906
MNKKRIMFVVFVLFLICSVSILSAKGTTEEKKDGAPKYAIILKTLGNSFWAAMKEGILEEAKKQGVEVDVFAVQSESDTEGQLRQFENLLGKKYAAIGFAPLSPINLVQPAAQAYKKGVKLVNIDERVDMGQLKNAQANVFAFITTDNKAVGAKGATFIIEKLGADGGEVAIIEGMAGNASGEDRKNGAKKVFESKSNIKLVASQPADWDRTKALDVAANMIQRYPKLKGIYCANDTMALGAVQAVINAGKAGQIVVVGTDGDPEALSFIKQGKLSATVAQDPAEIGAESLRRMIAAVKSGTQIAVNAQPDFIAVESKLITE